MSAPHCVPSLDVIDEVRQRGIHLYLDAIVRLGSEQPHDRSGGRRKNRVRAAGITQHQVHPASVFGIEARGELREGAFADLIMFDPAKVTDRATYQNPREVADGMDWVIVNGTIARKDGTFTGARAGKVLKRTR